MRPEFRTEKSIITCNLDAANGSQSIVAADLGHLQQANGSTITGAFSVQAQTVKATTTGDFTFNVTWATPPTQGRSRTPTDES